MSVGMNRQVDGLAQAETPSGADAARLRRDAVENRARILEAARGLFEESGIEAVSMHRIAQAADVGQATLYRHYVHKGDICRDLLAESTERAKSELSVYLQDNRHEPSLARLDGVIARMVGYFDQKLPYLAAIEDSCSGELRTVKYNLPEYRWIRGVVAELLAGAQAEGAISPCDPEFTADAVLAAIGPDMYQYQRYERGLTQEQIVQGVRRLYM